MERTITVKGVGSASTKPDQVQITLNLNATNLVYQKAMDMHHIINACFKREVLKY
jgi:uncharacterized protein YggE